MENKYIALDFSHINFIFSGGYGKCIVFRGSKFQILCPIFHECASIFQTRTWKIQVRPAEFKKATSVYVKSKRLDKTYKHLSKLFKQQDENFKHLLKMETFEWWPHKYERESPKNSLVAKEIACCNGGVISDNEPLAPLE